MTTIEIPPGLLDRFGIPSTNQQSIVDRIAGQAIRNNAGELVGRAIDQAMDRLERVTGRKPKRSVHPALLVGAGFAAGVVTVAVVAKRSRLWRRVSAQLREDALLHAERVADLDDTELAHKVESVVFRDPSLPKGKVSINAEDGNVFLRGQVDTPDTIVRIEKAVRAVEGVETVENLLHVPGTPAPHAQGGALLEADAR
jgi:hypothetical protein